MTQKLIPVILCGGSGTRLAPLSSQENPKQFLRLIDDYSLLQNTAIRAMQVANVSAEEIVTVTIENMISRVTHHYETIDTKLCQNIIGEGAACNTAAAVALAALYVENKYGDDALMWIMPSDHYIGDEDALKKSLNEAVKTAEEGYLTTFGIAPSRPETGYGYIEVGPEIEDLDRSKKINKFTEKPDAQTAQKFLESGNYLWNSGMFVFRAKDVLNAYQKHSRDILQQVKSSFSFEDGKLATDANLYARVDKQPFDIAIMEKSQNIAVVPSNPEWSDIGSWQSLLELKGKDGLMEIIGSLNAQAQQEILLSLKLIEAKVA